MISFRKDETIADFANCFYLEAQILTGSGSLTVHDAHIALRAAVKPYKALYQTLMLAFQDNCTLDGMVCYLCQCGDTFAPPTLDQSPAQFPTIQDAQRLSPTTTSPHQNPISLSTGRSQRGVEEELSTSTKSLNVPPDLLFTPDTGFLGDALHQVLVNNVHMVQTCSKVQASQEATKEVSKPYVCQLLDNTPDTEPQHSGDATPLRGINVAIPMETMKDHHPELYDSIVKFLSTANNLDIHLVNNISSSYSECTYADIFVNKLKV
ncbi:hypothetical protein DSO57_1021110 [Entomophthora muscae]|uniref:Uncharacterized protein n=1 Tax=Entomophthora muscae TaxID=34485 RepID=A0ACC2UND2_9FUNG|nr:hypothetical protein DSO57_1021110 [Entomophthora muscae]